MDTTEMMMTDKLNSGLIESMKEKIPEGAKCPLRLPKPR